MKKALKIIGILLLIVVVVLIGGFAIINAKGIPTYEPGNNEFKATITPEAVERGQNLALMLCASCHQNHETGTFIGSQMFDAPPEFGEIYSANITNHPEAGIGSWTDAEIAYLLRTGIKRDGVYAPMYMAKLPNLSDNDLNAIIAFLRSDHPAVAADPTPTTPSKPSFLTKFLCNMVWEPFPYPEKPIPDPDSSNKLELGKYLAVNLECFICHSADFKTNDYLSPELSEGYFGGGNTLYDTEGKKLLSANLTPSKTSGIGSWSEEQFIKAVKYGLVEGKESLRFPMRPYIYLSDYEASAIYEYLVTLAPIENKVDRAYQ